MISDILAVVDFLDQHATELSIKKALFNSNAQLLEGDESIKIQKVPTSNNSATTWYYKVEEQEGMVFLYFPLIPSVYVDFGTIHGNQNPDARLFRFVGSPMSTFAAGGLPNILVDFYVIGYYRDAFLRLKSQVS